MYEEMGLRMVIRRRGLWGIVLCNGRSQSQICLTVVVRDRGVKCGAIQKEEPIP